jgi:catechol 2,3-dioxygenase-like lactoylglutathione lyase family enzyme
MRIALTSVLVDDQTKALDFYTNVLGFETRMDVPAGEHRFVTVASPEGPDDVQLMLEPNAHPAGRTFQAAIYADGIPATSFASSDIQAEYERLTARGVVFRSPPKAMGPVTVATFDDTCGNLIQLHQTHPA